MQDGILIAHARKDQNLFILELAAPGKVIQVNIQAIMTIEQGSLMHLVSYIKKVHIWHRRFEYASNTKVIRASKLLTGIGDFSENYNPAKIYSDSKASKLEKSLNNPDPTDNNSADTNTVIATQ